MGAAGVPEPERPVIPALGHLALAPPGAPGRLVIAPLVASVNEPGARGAGDGHEGLHEWIPRPGGPAVRARIPPGHRGLPLGFCPFVATQRAALDALEDDPLFGEVLERVADAFKDSQDARRRNPPAVTSQATHPRCARRCRGTRPPNPAPRGPSPRSFAPVRAGSCIELRR